MRLSYLLALACSCCLITSCSDDSAKRVDSTTDPTSPCQGEGCSGTPLYPDDPPGDPLEPTEPPVDPPTECSEGIDLMTDANNCGECGHACVNATCVNGSCKCNDGLIDCDENGTCETEGECTCRLGDTYPCYDGDEGTKGVGICKEGHLNCIIDETGSYWDSTECIDQVLPAQTLSEFVCDPNDLNRDNDCNGVPDAQQDEDQDGFAICKDDAILDCCDHQKWCNTTKPELINPGVQIDCNDNQLDDNCNGTVDEGEISCNEPLPCEGPECDTVACKFTYGDCDQGLTWNNSNDANSALLLAQSMDICMPPSSDPTKGALIEYSVHRSGYVSNPVAPQQINILPGMKDKSGNALIKPRLGHSFALLSTGEAKDVFNGVSIDDQLYSQHNFDPSVAMFSYSLEDRAPAVYLSAHGNKLQSRPGCPENTPTEKNPYIIDSVVLHLKLQAPQDAKGFSFNSRFFSREYPNYVCSLFNDFFLAILTDEAGNPIGSTDGNIAFDSAGNPVTVNSAFFTTCYGSDSYDELFAYTPNPYNGEGDGSEKTNCGGSTAWLTTQAPINGGQIFNLDFYIWDTCDSQKDSTVILDNFRWLCDASSVSTEFAPPAENPIEIN